MSMPQEDPVLRSSRREATIILSIFVAALVYTVGYCWLFGYNRTVESLTFVFGFPEWVFWGIVVPWGVCLLLSWCCAYFLIRDEDLGEEEQPSTGM